MQLNDAIDTMYSLVMLHAALIKEHSGMDWKQVDSLMDPYRAAIHRLREEIDN